MTEFLKEILYWVTWLIPRPHLVLPSEGAILMRCGKTVKVVDAGWLWHWPPTDEILTAGVRDQVLDIRAQSITTKDGEIVAISGAVNFQIINLEKCLFNVHNFDESIVALSLGVIAHYVTQHDYKHCMASDVIATEIKKKLRDEATSKWGVKIVNVWITDFCKHKVIRVLGSDEGYYPDSDDEEI